MKKTLHKIILILALGLSSCLIATAQNLKNGDFNSYTAIPGLPSEYIIFTDWTATGSGAFGSNTINGGTDNCAKMEAKATFPTTTYCDPKNLTSCYTQQTGPTSIQIGGITQSFTPTSLPAKLDGKVNFRATYNSANVTINAGILLEGSFDGYAILDTLLFDSGKTGSFSLNINPKLDSNCKVNTCTNYLTVKIISCFGPNCDGQLQGGGFTASNSAILYIDDLVFSGTNTFTGTNASGTTNGLFDSKTTELSIYPNPAKDVVHVSGKAEIFDLVGNKVASGENEINIEHLFSGIYVVKANGKSQKIIKE